MNGITRIERYVFVGVAALTFVYVLLRAINLSFVHDEAVSFFEYARTGSFQPGFGHWDAGNHLLNSLFGRISYLTIGMSPGALRAGSVLCFVLYAVYIWKLGAMVHHMLVRNCMRYALLLTPFVLDFFSLFRGYGPALAFGSMGLYYLMRFATSAKWRHAYTALFGLVVAGFSSLSMVLLAAVVMVLLGAMAIAHGGSWSNRLKQLAGLALLGAPALSYLLWYGQELGSRGMLYHGSKAGLFEGTLASVSRLVLGADSTVVLWLLVALLGLSAAIAALPLRSWIQPPISPLRALLLCLIGELVGRTALWSISGILYPIDRVALHLIPLYLIVLGLAMDKAAERRPVISVLSLAYLVFPVRVFMGLNLQGTMLWPEESVSDGLIQALEVRQVRSERPLVISCWQGFMPIMLYARAYQHQDLPIPTPVGFPLAQADLLLTDTTHMVDTTNFRSIWRSETGLIRLLERVAPLSLDPILDTTIRFSLTPGPFINLWEGPARSAETAYLLDVSIRMRTTGPAPAIHLVSDAHGPSNEPIHYDGLQLQRVHQEWNWDTLRIARHIPRLRPGDWAGLYLWVVNGRWIEGDCRIRAYRIVD